MHVIVISSMAILAAEDRNAADKHDTDRVEVAILMC